MKRVESVENVNDVEHDAKPIKDLNDELAVALTNPKHIAQGINSKEQQEFMNKSLAEVVELLAQGASANDFAGSLMDNDIPDIPLNRAAMYNAEAILPLLAAGANINKRGPDGWTPLHSAAGVFNKPSICLLLERGADASAATHRGKLTSLTCAIRSVSLILNGTWFGLTSAEEKEVYLVQCLEPLIQATLLNNPNANRPEFEVIPDVGLIKRFSAHWDSCCSEVRQMQDEEITKEVYAEETRNAPLDGPPGDDASLSANASVKSKGIAEGIFSLYQFCSETNNNKLAAMCSPRVVDTLQSPLLTERYPIYSGQIKRNVQTGIVTRDADAFQAAKVETMRTAFSFFSKDGATSQPLVEMPPCSPSPPPSLR